MIVLGTIVKDSNADIFLRGCAIMPRQARLDTPGTLHHVIIRGIEKRPIVNDVRDKKEFVFRMGDISTEEKTTIYAWSLMATHAHILLRSGPYGVSQFMRQFLTGYAIYYNHRHKRHGHSSRGGSSTFSKPI